MNFRLVYTFTILFVIFYSTMADSDDRRLCDAEECDAECKYRMELDHGKCRKNPVTKEDYEFCYCFFGSKSPYGMETEINWCRDEMPEYRCLPIFRRNTPHCNFSDCEYACRNRYEGPRHWTEVLGTCKVDPKCQCLGKPSPSRDLQFINSTRLRNLPITILTSTPDYL